MLFHFHEMDTNHSLHDEDYIDMELSSSSSSSPQSREFEFQKMSLTCNDRETTTFPADELFYKGKLLPLLLPPRRQMVQNLLHTTSTTTTTFDITKESFCSTAPCTNTVNTPLDSCNISPSESCRVSCELNPDDYFFEWSTELSSFINNHNHIHNHFPTKKPWSKKLKLIKQSILAQKLKASRAYLKSLFTKSACSDESNVQRRSFSGAIKRHSPAKCMSSSSSNSSSAASSSSSSFSLNSNGFHELHFLRRSSSATEIEGSIEAAIAHCKKSQQILDSRNQLGICSLSESRIADEERDQKGPGLCSTNLMEESLNLEKT